jgi:hypothetical protein
MGYKGGLTLQNIEQRINFLKESQQMLLSLKTVSGEKIIHTRR